MTLAEFLKNERLKRALTQEEMAKLIGCSLDHYKHVENGTSKAGVVLQKNIAKVTRKSTTFIYKLVNKEEE